MDDHEWKFQKRKVSISLSQRNKSQKLRETLVLQSFEIRECTHFAETLDSDQVDGRTDERLCQCGLKRSSHTEELLYNSSQFERQQWRTNTHTDTKTTNTYGEIEFPGYSVKPAKYIRLDHMTDPKRIVKLMTNWWQLNAPNLLISVTGGAKDFMLTSKLKAAFRTGLTNVALSTNAWIITGGTHTGVMKLVGEAVRDYTLGSGSYGRRSIVSIGVVPWGVVHKRENLINKENRYKVQYQVEDPDSVEASLDPSHSHFILVDDGTCNKYGTEIELRGKLERAISEIHQETEKDGNLTIPTVCLVLEGGPGTLETVRSAIYNDTPVVIVAGSGRAADLLTWAVRNIRTENAKFMQKKLRSKVQSMFGQKHMDKSIQLVLDCIKNEDLITIYELNAKGSEMDIDIAILQSLLKAKRADQKGQLHLALAMNRIDIAESVLCKEGNWKVKDRQQLLEKAFVNNQVEFVKLFIENGVDLRTFLTVERLTILYNKIRKTTLLNRLLRRIQSRTSKKRNQRTKGKFTLRDVGHLIKDLADNTYDVLYLRDVNTYQVQASDQNANKEIGNTNVFAKPRRELFLWAVFLNRHEMAKLFLEGMNDAMAAALVASRFLKSMARRETDVDDRLRLLDKRKEYEQLAYDILTECYKDDEEATLLLLVRPLHFWGNSTCLRLAISADDKNFVAHTAVQELLSRIWYGNIDRERTSALRLLCCLCFPPLMYCFVKYREPQDKDENEDLEIDRYNQYATLYKDKTEIKHTSDSEGTLMIQLNGNNVPSIEEEYTCLGPNEGIDIRANTDPRKLEGFFNTPIVKFFYCTVWYVAFLLLISRFLLVDYSDYFSTTEIISIIWVTTFAFDEIRQIIQLETKGFVMKIKSWMLDDYWNILDVISLVGFYAGLIVKLSGKLEAGRKVFAVDILLFYIRLTHVFSIYRTIGPKLIIIGKMLVDLVIIVCITFIVIAGYGVAVQAIQYPEEKHTWTIVKGIFHHPYFHIYGELFLEDEKGCSTNETQIQSGAVRCRQEHTMLSIFLAVYMVLCNILLLNLVIAMFSYTFSKIQARTDLFWKFQRYGLIADYQLRPLLFPPLIIFSHIRLCVHAILGRCCHKARLGKKTLRQRLTGEEDKLLSLFELISVERYFAKKKHDESTKLDVEIKEVRQKVDSLMKHVEYMESQFDRVMLSNNEKDTEDDIPSQTLSVISEETVNRRQ
ncbi:transient receptor potential cation channel subfamily M member 2-like [Glandiceps talaboti]